MIDLKDDEIALLYVIDDFNQRVRKDPVNNVLMGKW